MSGWPIDPVTALAFVTTVTVLAAVGEGLALRRRRKALHQMAATWQMTYSPCDRLRVGSKITGYLPAPGAADVQARDVIYGVEGDLYRYVFTAEYTLGAARLKRREVRVGSFTEGRGNIAKPIVAVAFAPEDLSVLAQYQHFAPVSAGVASPLRGSSP